MGRSSDLLNSWKKEQPKYDRLAKRVQIVLREATRSIGLRCETEARAKDLASYVKKMIARERKGDTSEISDKAGARVICWFDADRGELQRLITNTFDTRDWDDKRTSLAHNTLGYLGLHCQAKLKDTTDDPELADLECEIQIHTSAEHAWSAPMHDIIYKPPLEVADKLKRPAYRLLALTEIFDAEVTRVREEVLKMPDFKEAQILASLERDFYRLTGRDFDRELSFEILRALAPLYGAQNGEAISAKLSAFVEANNEKLARIFQRYEEDDSDFTIFLFQPEAIAVFERIEDDSYKLKALCDRSFEESYLAGLSTIWGTPLGT